VPTERRCAGQNKKGGACQAAPRRGSEFCFLHDPATAQDAARARRQGGKKRCEKRPSATPANGIDMRLDTVEDVVKLLAASINQVRRGELDVKQANAVGYLAGHLLKGLQGTELEKRIAALENARDNDRQSVPSSQAAGTPGGACAGDPGANPPRPGDDLPGGGQDGGPLATGIAPLFG
jgi:hypothetical protein